MSTLSFYRRVIDETGQEDRLAVLAQLPRDLKEVWEDA